MRTSGSTTQRSPRRLGRRDWVRWTATFLAFPVAGLAARAVVGPVDDAGAAVVGGAVVGAVLGTAQALALPTRLPWARWAAATAAGVAVGLALGASAVGYRTGLGDLATVGAVTGVVVGTVQAAVALRRSSVGARIAWVAASTALWALGWSVTTLAGVDVDRQHAVFGATGALTWTLLAGLVLGALAPPRDASPVDGTARAAGDAR